ncbi:MAG: TspO/MBR family protein [Patescibacteria group bacterium]
MSSTTKLVLAIVISELAGVVGSLFTMPAIAGWYGTLRKPSFAPPDWVFGPVWTTLFLLMGIAAFLVWREDGKAGIAASPRAPRNDKNIALAIFAVQLVLNVLWSALFFGMRSPGAALVEIVVLWIAILATIIAFARISRPAAYLLVPYIAWVSFAIVLNYQFWNLNR